LISRFFSFNNVSALQIFQSFRFLAAILISILLVKGGLEIVEVSFYEILFFLGNFISLFWVQGLKNGLLSYFPSLGTRDQKKLIFNLFLVFLVLGVLSSSMLFLFKDFIISYLTSYSTIPHIELICIFVIINTPTILIEFTYLLLDKSKSIVKYGAAIFFLQVTLILVGLIFFDGIRVLLLLMILWASVKLIWLIQLLFKRAEFSFDSKIQRNFLIFSFPLVLHILLGNAMEYVVGFIVSKFFEEEMFAVFRYGARELPISLILVGALASAMVPSLVKDFDKSIQELKIKVTNLMKWLYPLSMVLMLLSPIIYPIVYSEDFALSARIFNLYLLILASRIILAQTIIYAKHDNKILAYFASVELLCNLLLSIWWSQLFGIEGIVYATIVAFLLNKILLILYNHYKYDIPLHRYLDLKIYFAFNLSLLICFYISLQY
jgi:O-antigen/teichoic acid export membrane protein